MNFFSFYRCLCRNPQLKFEYFWLKTRTFEIPPKIIKQYKASSLSQLLRSSTRILIALLLRSGCKGAVNCHKELRWARRLGSVSLTSWFYVIMILSWCRFGLFETETLCSARKEEVGYIFMVFETIGNSCWVLREICDTPDPSCFAGVVVSICRLHRSQYIRDVLR